MAELVDELARRLYGLPLEEFTRERDAAARELRKAKDRDTAAVVAKLPKPSQAAWAANTLAREQRGLVDDLLAAGERLRDAQDAAVAGRGAGALREAGAAERAAVEALVDAATDLKPSGRRPTAATLERLRTTLHAAASDDDVRQALDAGRLVEDVAGGGAWGLFGAGDEPQAPKPRAKKAAPAAAPAKRDHQREERERKEREARDAAEQEARRRLEAELREARAERRSRDRELERAEKAAARADERLQEAREQAEEADVELEAAREAADEARDHVARLEEQLD